MDNTQTEKKKEMPFLSLVAYPLGRKTPSLQGGDIRPIA